MLIEKFSKECNIFYGLMIIDKYDLKVQNICII